MPHNSPTIPVSLPLILIYNAPSVAAATAAAFLSDPSRDGGGQCLALARNSGSSAASVASRAAVSRAAALVAAAATAEAEAEAEAAVEGRAAVDSSSSTF